ncbi:MAG TPA: YqgE/AlgH family protein [Usitatibacter sp.]|nr:YqgE/AlgH family protein [Usitatibacter sp.]
MTVSLPRLAAAIAVLAFACAADARELAADAGDFLVANKDLIDFNFAETVVLVTRSEPGGTAGLVITRPSLIPVSRLFPDMPKIASLPDMIFVGGPVAPDRVSFLFRADSAPADSRFVMKGLYLSDSETLLRSLLSRADPMQGLRIYLGSAGWGPTQLENERLRGDWHVMRGDVDSVFTKRLGSLWLDLDRRASSIQARNHLEPGAPDAIEPAGSAVAAASLVAAPRRPSQPVTTCRGCAMKVNEVMTRNVCVASPRMSIGKAAQMMSECDSGVLPVGEDDRLVGMITDRDIAIRAVARGKAHDTPVREVMSHEVLYCYEDEDIDDVGRNMADQQVRRLPVVNRDKRLVGIVSLGDMSPHLRAKDAGATIAAISKPGGRHDQVLH